MNNCPMCTKWQDEPELRIVELAHSFVLLNRDQFFPGYSFLVAKAHVTELFHLEPRDRQALLDEVTVVARALYTVFQPAKMNYELLGNMVPHIHWHLVPRFRDDPLWPRPIWSEPHEPAALTTQQSAERIRAIQGELTRFP